MSIIEIVIGRWQSSQLDFLITAAMPFFILAVIWTFGFQQQRRLVKTLILLAILCSLASILYAPVCGCTDAEQRIGTTVIALAICLLFFGPVILGHFLWHRWQAYRLKA